MEQELDSRHASNGKLQAIIRVQALDEARAMLLSSGQIIHSTPCIELKLSSA